MLKFYILDGQLKLELGTYAEPDGMLQITYDNVWELATAKKAVFRRRQNAEEYVVPLHHGKCHIPYELLERNNSFQVCLKSNNASTEFEAVPCEAARFDAKMYIVPQLEKLSKSVRDNSCCIEWLEDNMPKDTVSSQQLEAAVNDIKSGDFSGVTLKAKSLKTENSIQVREIKNTFDYDYAKDTASIRETETGIGLKFLRENKQYNRTEESQINIHSDKITAHAESEISIGSGNTPKVNVDAYDTVKLDINGDNKLWADVSSVKLNAANVILQPGGGEPEVAHFNSDNIEIRTFDNVNNVKTRVYLDDDAKLESKNITALAANHLYMQAGDNGFGLSATNNGVFLTGSLTGTLEDYIKQTSLFDILKTVLTAINFNPKNV